MINQEEISFTGANVLVSNESKAPLRRARMQHVILGLLGYLLAATAAQSATLEQVHMFDRSGVEFEEIVTFDLFNEPGTLTGVLLSIDVASEGEVALNLCHTLGDCNPAQFLLSANAFGGGIGTGDSLTVDYSTNAAQYPAFSANLMGAIAADPMMFAGVGQTNPVSITGAYQGAYFFGSGDHSGTLTLTYTYDDTLSEVPLPASLPLALGGLLLLHGIAKRRKAGDGKY